MISLDSRTHAKLIFIGALFAPVIAVQGVRFLASSELSSASAQVTPAPAEIKLPPAVVKPLSPKQSAALEWVRQAPRVADRSPMEVPRTAAPERTDPDQPHGQATPVTGPVDARPVEPPDDRPRHLKLTGMIGSDADALAAVSGKLRRVGDEPAPGWVIRQIDSRNRLVVLQHTDGRVFTISPPTPPLER